MLLDGRNGALPVVTSNNDRHECEVRVKRLLFREVLLADEINNSGEIVSVSKLQSVDICCDNPQIKFRHNGATKGQSEERIWAHKPVNL